HSSGVEAREAEPVPAGHEPGDDEAAATGAWLHEARIPRAPPPRALRQPAVQIAADAPARGEVELRDDERVPQPIVAHTTVDAVAAHHAPRRGVRDAQLRRALAVVPQEGDPPAVWRDARHGFGPQSRGENISRRDARLGHREAGARAPPRCEAAC